MKLKTSELAGKTLAWAVAHCEGFDTRNNYAVRYILDNILQEDSFVCLADDANHAWEQCENAYPGCVLVAVNRIAPYDPTEPNVGLPILQRENISLRAPKTYWPHWTACVYVPQVGAGMVDSQAVSGPDMMTAGLRCYVASKYGEYIEVPDEFAFLSLS